MGEVHQGLDRVGGSGVDGCVGTELGGERQPFRPDFDGDHPRAHGFPEQCGAETHRSQAEYREGRAPQSGQAAQRTVRGSRAAGDCRAFRKAECFR